MKRAAPFAAALALTYSGMAGGQPAVPAVLSDFQRDVDSITPYAYESFKAGGPDLPEKIVRLAYDANPGLKRYDDAFRKVMDEVQSTIVTGRPAVWLIYNMGVVVKTPQPSRLREPRPSSPSGASASSDAVRGREEARQILRRRGRAHQTLVLAR